MWIISRTATASLMYCNLIMRRCNSIAFSFSTPSRQILRLRLPTRKTIPNSLLAITLEGCHEVQHEKDGQLVPLSSNPGEALFFSRRPVHLNTNRFPRFVAAITFSHESVDLFLIRHPGGKDKPAEIQTENIGPYLRPADSVPPAFTA